MCGAPHESAHFVSRARRNSPAPPRAGPGLSEYQASLDRLRDLGFDGDAELLERSLPVPHVARPTGSSWAAATSEPQMSPSELITFDKFVALLSARSDDSMLGLTKLALNRAHTHVRAGGRTSPQNELSNLSRSSEAAKLSESLKAESERVEAEKMKVMSRRIIVTLEREGTESTIVMMRSRSCSR